MRIPTEEELKRQRASQEDQICVPEPDEGPKSLDDVVDVDGEHLRKVIMSAEYHKTVKAYHLKFIEIAAERGLTFNAGAYPSLDSIDIPAPLEFSVTVDPMDDDSIIEARLDVFKKEVLAEVMRQRSVPSGWEPWFITRHAKEKGGRDKKMEGLFTHIDLALQAYSLMQENGAKQKEVAYKMKLVRSKCSHEEMEAARKDVVRHYKFAQRLIKAAVQGTFLDELSKPLRN